MRTWTRGVRRHVFAALLGWILFASIHVVPAAAGRPDRVANVIVFSTRSNTPLVEALAVDDEAIDITVVTRDVLSLMSLDEFNETLAKADVVFVDRFLPDDPGELWLLEHHLNGTSGHDGLVMFGFLQNGTTPGAGDFTAAQLSALSSRLPVAIPPGYTNSTADSTSTGFVVEVKTTFFVPEASNILASCIPWEYCPLIDRRLVVPAGPGATVVLTGDPGNETVLAERIDVENGSSAIFFSAEIAEHNLPFTSSVYFKYLMYVCTFHAMANYSDAMIEPWDEWPFSPGYGGNQPWAWIVVVVGLVGVASWLHLKARKNAQPRQGEMGGEPGVSGAPAAEGKAAATGHPGGVERLPGSP